jgi:multiple sugar transport system substrate-binding protein
VFFGFFSRFQFRHVLSSFRKEMKMENSKRSLRPMSRRQVLRLMGGAAGMAALAACAPVAVPGAAPAAGDGAPSVAPTTLEVQHRREYFAEMETLFAEAVRDWAAENNVEVETTTVAAEADQDFVAKLFASVEAGNPPDVVYHVRLVQQLYFLNAVQSVSDAVAETERLYGPALPGQRSEHFIDGDWYSIPYTMHGGGKFLRQDVFEEHGFDVNEIDTWMALRDACLEVSDPAASMYGWGATVNRSGDGHGLVVDILHNWGGHLTDAEMTQLTFNSPETVAAFEWLTELYTSPEYAPMLPPGILSWTDASNNEAWLAGSVAYTSNAASLYAKSKADGNPLYDVTAMIPTPMGPLGEPLRGGSGGGSFVIPRGSRNVEGAKSMAMYLLEPEVFLPISLVSTGLFLPAYDDYYQMEAVVEAFADDPNLARMGENLRGDYKGFPWPATPNPFFDAVNAESILTDILALTITQGVDPATAVAQAEDRMARIADEMEVFA